MKKVQDYILDKSLGKGSFGEVFLTKKENCSKLYATKKIPLTHLKNKEFEKYINNEIKIMKKLDHENVIKLYDFYQTSNNLYLIMDYINGGSLSEYLAEYKLKKGSAFPQKIIQYFVKQIVQGLIYIHSKNIIHRDIKLDNILINFPANTKKENRDYTLAQIKIIDFGLSTDSNLATSLVGSPIYMDPVILEKYKKAGGIEKFKRYDKKADIWSLGAITYEMLTGEVLFNAESLPELISKVKKGDYSLDVKDLSDEILSFLNCMLQYDPKKRLSAKELAKHQFLTKKTDEFKTVDTSQISYKINKYGVLTLNIINNETIKRLYPFNPDKDKNEIFNSLTINLDLISDQFSNKSANDTSNQDDSSNNTNHNDINNKNINNNINNNNQIIQDITKSQEPTKTTFILNDIPKTETMIFSSNIQPSGPNKILKKLEKTNSHEIQKNNTNKEEIQVGLHSAKSGNILDKSKTEKYQVKFEVKRIDNKKENVFLNIVFLVKENETRQHDVILKEGNGFYDEWIWKFHSNEWKNIDNNNETFIMTILFNEYGDNDNLSFNLESLKLGHPISFVVKKYINFKLIPIIKP